MQNTQTPYRKSSPLNAWNHVPKTRFTFFLSAIFLLIGSLPHTVYSSENSPASQTVGKNSSTMDSGSDLSALKEKFQKVIISSLQAQKVPFKKFSWLATKEIASNVTAFPFSLEIGNRKIVSVVYLVNGRYLVTSPLLDVSQNYKPVPDIPPPSPIAMDLSSSLFPLDRFPTTGNPSSPSRVIEFGDDQCPTCRKWNQEEEDKLRKDPSIQFTYIPLPLVTIHHNALKAAVFEMCVFRNKPQAFWNVHDLLNRRVELESVDEKDLDGVLSGLISSQGLPATKMNQCILDQEPLVDIQKADDILTQRTGIPSTPTFIIGSHVRTGFISYEEIKKILGPNSTSR